MKKLIDKPPTIPSKGTANKRDTNFLFAILPKEKVKTLQLVKYDLNISYLNF